MVTTVVKKRQFWVVISVVKKRQFWVVISVVKKRDSFGLLLTWLKKGTLVRLLGL